MATVVKLSERAKARLDRLQSRLIHRYGKQVTKQEVLEALLEVGEGHEEELVARLLGIRYPIPDSEWKKVLRLVEDWGVRTSPEEIDRVLYGAKDE